MGEMTNFWKQMDAVKAKAKAEQDETKSIIEDLVCLGGKWRFAGVREGGKWTARHRYDGEVTAPTSAGLIEKVKACVAKAEAKRATG